MLYHFEKSPTATKAFRDLNELFAVKEQSVKEKSEDGLNVSNPTTQT
jgi:hypothetical protein